ncbi:aldehyde dehydrogenase family protein [Lentzea aerocolonigenes]|uniref:aldehyde dehydrogenase family protein n=1 Tax=Lentzea aerocolonigenes TaxID=68170 RepID=UPI0004C387FD|nr:aldehyde dehydrogenase family protein [Lentzea aerocolonigenes]MCP2243997.1 phenylacetaldehyde dehydrogenase [Lentzea aerocolonigenes]
MTTVDSTSLPASTPFGVSSFLAVEHGLYIGGRWRPSSSGETIRSINPATGRPLATFARGTESDVDDAVTAARAALANPEWRDISPLQRGELLHRLAELVEAHADELAFLESLDNGKPVSVARAVDAGTTAKLFRYFAGWPSKFEGSTIPLSPRGGLKILNYTVHEPIGVVGAIVPWNFPMSMASWKLAPALAMGNAVVLKPAEETSLSTLRLAELVEQAGFPPGVLNVVTGSGSVVGAAIAAHPGVDKVAFTGSTEVGRLITSAALGNMKKVSLELGGKSPHIVLPDADVTAVAAAAAEGIFFNQGQTCTAGSRLYVHEDVYDDVMSALVDHARRIVVGPGQDPATQMGPLVSARQLATVQSYVESGLSEGAELVTGGARPSGLGDEHSDGYFIEPTVLTETTHSMRVVQEEIFGPVLVAMRWREVDDLIDKANDSPYGLSAGLWTNDLKQAHRIAAAIKAGTVWINCYNLTDPASPFGGYKQSGWGREMGRGVLEQYTETKSVWVNLS